MNKLVRLIGVSALIAPIFANAYDLQSKPVDSFTYNIKEKNEQSRSYNAQFLNLITSSIAPSSDHIGSNSEGVMALNNIRDLFTENKMLLKNVVYRSDTGYLRITFSSENDDYVVKGTYGTSFDDVLVNSNYADKKKLIDLKIMYLPEGGKEYKYFHIYNTDRKYDGKRVVGVEPVADGKTCKYCHQIAKISGSKSGLFFRRYQHESDAKPLHVKSFFENIPDIFEENKFVRMSKTPSWIPDGFKDKSVKYHILDVRYKYIKTIIDGRERTVMRTSNKKYYDERNLILESPQLLETFSRDNKQSYCIGFIQGDSNKVTEEKGINFVCSDYVGKRIYTRFQRQGDGKLIETNQPFYEKNNNGEISYR